MPDVVNADSDMLHLQLDRFQASVEYTHAITNFRANLIERDYFCSLLLRYFYEHPDCPMIFKGGTSLTKIHLGFYRLSEDLDFSIPIASNVTRKIRREAIKPCKAIFDSIPIKFPEIRIADPLAGSNESKQYNGGLEYISIMNNQPARIEIEIGLREELHDPVIQGMARTILQDPFLKSDVIKPIPVRSLSLHEAYAEKLRAALTRLKPAIRDFFDLDVALREKKIQLDERRLVDLVKKKLAVEGTGDIDLSEKKVAELTRQLESELFPTLKTSDFRNFQLERIIPFLRIFSEKL